jgi:hypothetical protein
MNLAAYSACMLAGTVLAVGTARAHHSYAMFDGTKRVTLEGVVARLDWQNPHVFIWVYVPREGGGHELYGIETDSVNALLRRGWSKSSLQPGEQVAVELFPLVDGRPGGHLIRVIRPDGELAGQPGPVIAISSGIGSGLPPTSPPQRPE